VSINAWTTELELNVLVYPTAMASIVPTVSLQQFLLGDEVTRLIGHYRVKVPANSPIAILAGKAAFGEPKFPGIFTSTIPSLNDPAMNDPAMNNPAMRTDSFNTWQFAIYAPPQYKDKPPPPWEKKGDLMLDCEVKLTGLSALQANPSPISYYGQHLQKFETLNPPSLSYYFDIPVYAPDLPTIGARWNIQLAAMTYGDGRTPLPPETVQLRYGDTAYACFVKAMHRLVGDAPCMAVCTLMSQPAAIESGAYYLGQSTHNS
jgi:hypothetical protein